jgi:hypothetical protein
MVVVVDVVDVGCSDHVDVHYDQQHDDLVVTNDLDAAADAAVVVELTQVLVPGMEMKGEG